MLDFASNSVSVRFEKLPVVFSKHFVPLIYFLISSWTRYPFLLGHYVLGKSQKLLFVDFAQRRVVEPFVDPIVIRSFVFSTSPISSFTQGFLY